MVGREGFEPPQLSRVVYSHLSSQCPADPLGSRNRTKSRRRRFAKAPAETNLIIPPVTRSPQGYARYVLVVMVGINFLNYMDRWVASSAATPIEKEFHLTDAQFGLIGTAFLLVYAVAVLPFGYWGDRGVRKTVIGVGVTIWSVATLFT